MSSAPHVDWYSSCIRWLLTPLAGLWCLFLLATWLFIRFQHPLYSKEFLPMWHSQVLELGMFRCPGRMWVILAVLFGSYLIIRGPVRCLGKQRLRAIGRLVPDDVIGLIRYARQHAAAS